MNLPHQYLHEHPEFTDILDIVSKQQGIIPSLIEKDYWMMHCLYGLQQLGLTFELKGGTSLSKGWKILNRFSEDIDIRIEPPLELNVKVGSNHMSPKHRESRKHFYDYLANTLDIDGVIEVSRDENFDDAKYRSGGIRIHFPSSFETIVGVKDGILLEVGFDDVIPNVPHTISSWAFDYASKLIPIIDNRARDVACYHIGYALVEKLQTISTKFRTQQEQGTMPQNFVRHYYDVYCLLRVPSVQAFIGTEEFYQHKAKRFRKNDNLNLLENEAFLLSKLEVRTLYEQSFERTRALYYDQPPRFSKILEVIQDNLPRLS